MSIVPWIGLGRLEEAEARIAELGQTLWRPWYAAYLAAAKGDTASAAQAVEDAVRAGLPVRARLRTAPLLEPLRRSPEWARVEALGPG